MEPSVSENQGVEEPTQESEVEVSEKNEEIKEHVTDLQANDSLSEVIPANVDTDVDALNNPQQISGEPITQPGVSDEITEEQKQLSPEQIDLNMDAKKEDLADLDDAKVVTTGEDEPLNQAKPSEMSEEVIPSTRPTSRTEVPKTDQDPYFMAQAASDDEATSNSEMQRRTPTEDTSIGNAEYKYDQRNPTPPIGAASDNSESSSAGESEGAQEEKQRIREQLVEQYRQAVIEHKIARETNLQLQTKLAEYFRRKKADAAEQQSGTSSVGGSTADGAVDYEQRYNKYILSLTELRQQYQSMQNSYHKQIEELKNVCSQRQQEVEQAYKEFTNYKYNIGKKALHSRTGRPINPKDLLAMLAAEQKKEAVVMEVRLENIKLRNEVAKVEAVLKSKEELAEGLHLIDFEQLKIENQTYNEKIEERNEELAKLKKKISNTVQIMTHVKEKLQAVQHDNAKQRQRLGIADAELTFNRDQLTKLKQARDHLRADNSRLRRSCGLLGKSALLFNYENSVDAVNSKRAALEETKRITSQYRSRTKSLMDKIGNIQEKAVNR